MFYQYGRDKLYRPIVISNYHKIYPKHVILWRLVINFIKNSEEHTIEALCYFLRKVQTTMFYPGKVENWIIILETNKMIFFKFQIDVRFFFQIVLIIYSYEILCLKKI